MRDRPNGMTRNSETQIVELSKLMWCDTRISTSTNSKMISNPKKQVMNLGQLMRSDSRISTPLNGSTSHIWHNVIKWMWLIIKIHRLLYLRHPKRKAHYRRSNDILFIPYSTLHKLSVGIIGVDREIRVDLSNQVSWRRMVYIHQRQLALMLKISPNFRVKLI